MNGAIIEKISNFGLTPEQYELCLSDAYNKVNRMNDMDWQEIVKKYDLDLHYDTLRKASQTIFGGAFVYEYFKEKQCCDEPDDYLAEIQEAKQELKKERQKLSDERTALNRSLRNTARLEADISKLESILKEKSKIDFPEVNVNIECESDNDLIVLLSDFHLGLNTNNKFGTYNAEIASERLNKYFQKIVSIRNLHKSKNVYIFILGDIINGNIHMTTQLENRENVVEQVQRSSELISDFTYKLSQHFRNTYVNSVSGNHSRLGRKDEVLRDCRLDDIILWYMKARLHHLENVIFIDDNYDATIGSCNIRNHDYVLVHGDFDKFSENGVSKLVMMLGYKPTAIFYGHLHRCSLDEYAGVKIIRSGSFSGTSDDYTISKRISGNPSQMVCVVSNEGVQCCYPIELN